MADLRHAAIKVSGAPELQLRVFRGREALGRIFEYDVELWSLNPGLKFEDMLGKAATISVALPTNGGSKRFFTGIINRFELTGLQNGFANYRATLVPWMWFLTRTTDCAIFPMGKKATEHIEQVLRAGTLGMGDVKLKLNASDYRTWEYCVQYNESNFNFVSRLMEQEGLYYFFRHQSAGKHDLVLADGPESHNDFDLGPIEFHQPGQGKKDIAAIRSWAMEGRIQPANYMMRDWDFMNPTAPVAGVAGAQQSMGPSDSEVYEYPGEFLNDGEGNRYAKIRLEALSCQQMVCRGSTDHPFMETGCTFTLQGGDHMYRSDQDKAWLVTGAAYEVHVAPRALGEPGSDGPAWACTFTAIDATTVFRSTRVTPKPVIQGPQTAVITGKTDNEIDADEQGRVTVKFPWDRSDKFDDQSSCRVRVSHNWAGKGWGHLYTPRVGQEVIVEFEDGDPDCPIITGRVYNGENKPPYDPKQFPTLSTNKSSTSKGGEGFNEIRFEDKKDSEMIWIHAQRRLDVRVRGTMLETNYGDRHVRVGWEGDGGETGGMYNILVKDEQNEWIKKALYEKIEKVVNRVVLEDVVEDFQKNQFTIIKENLHLNAAKIFVEAKDLYSLKSKKVLIEGSTDGMSIKSGADMKLTANGALALKAGQKLVGEGQLGVSLKGLGIAIEGQTGVTLKCGGSFVEVGPAGVFISGPLVLINSGGAASGTAESAAQADPAEPVESTDRLDPLEATAASTGNPTQVSGGGGGGVPPRTPIPVDPQHAPDSPPFPPPPLPVTPPPPPPPPTDPTTEEWEIAELVECYDDSGTPTQAASGRARQFVNHDRAGTTEWDHGRVIFLKAKLRWKAGDPSRPLTGKEVFWKSVPDGANRASLVAALKGGFDTQGSETMEKTVTVDDQGWTPVQQFHLTRYGGDKFKFQAASDSGFANKLESGEYIVWRKLAYELDGMLRPGAGTYKDKFEAATLSSRFEGEFVQLGTIGSDSAPAHQRVVTENEVGTFSAGCRDAADGPRYFHLVFIDTIAWDAATDTITRTLTPGGSIGFDPGVWTLDPRDYFVSAKWRQPVGSGTWNNLTAAQVTLSDADNTAGQARQWLDFDFSGTTADTTRDIELELTIKHWDEGSGIQSGAATIVGMRWRERQFSGAQLTARTMRTAIHEPGHRMGLCSKKLPDGTANSDFYSNAGGHCHANSDGCVMYGINDKDATNFCPNCKDALRGSNLGALPQDGRNDLF